MALDGMQKIDLTRVPLLFARGGVLKKGAQWNQETILEAGTEVTQEFIDEYRDIAQHVPVSLRIESTVADTEEMIRGNIQSFMARRKADKMSDLSQGYLDGETVFQQGDTSDKDCYFLVDGSVHVERDGQRLATIDDPGLPIGEMSFLTGEPRSASVIAARKCKLLRIRHSERQAVLRSNPTLVKSLLQVLVQRLTQTSGQLVAARDEAARTKAESRDHDADTFDRLKTAQRDLVRHLEMESGLRLGNKTVLRQLLNALGKRGGDAVDQVEPGEIFATMDAYLRYLDAQDEPEFIDPVILSDRLPETIARLLRDSDTGQAKTGVDPAAPAE